MNLETKITIYKFTPQVFTLTHSIYNPIFVINKDINKVINRLIHL